jgi:NAD+ kinase
VIVEPAPFDPHAVRCVSLLPLPQWDRVREALHQVTAWFTARDLRVLLPQAAAQELGLRGHGADGAALLEQADLIVSLGGDGTLLSAARLAAPLGRPVLGINLGGFGFLAALPQAGLLDHLTRVMEGDLILQSRMMLQAEVQRGGATVATFTALNDIVLARGAISRLFRLTTSISGEPVSTFPADGMIVSTPTGSTGYALSAGGPVLDPELRAFIITPICAHTLSARTLVTPADHPITLSLPAGNAEDVHLTADGQEGMSLQAGDCVEITEAPFSARLITLPGETFYAKLRDKLGWGGPR